MTTYGSLLRVGLGATSTAAAVGRTGVRVLAAGWHSPLLGPVRGPLDAAGHAVEQRGARDQERVAAAADRLLREALRGPLGDELIRAIVETRLAERLVERALDDETLERLIAIAAERRAAVRATDAVLAADGAATELIDHVLASTVADAVTERVLASEELHRIVGHIARSDEVRAALSAQSEGLAQDVAEEARRIAGSADDNLERRARRLLRRRERPETFQLDDDAATP